jgi:hypothetical protein
MKKINTALVSTLSLFIANGCSSPAVERELGQKVSQESSIKTQGDLSLHSDQLLKENLRLSNDQRQQLMALKKEAQLLTAKQNSESLKLRSVLIKDMLSANYNHSEVSLIKNKLRKTESNKIDILLNAVKKANIILGNEIDKNEIFLREVYQINE